MVKQVVIHAKYRLSNKLRDLDMADRIKLTLVKSKIGNNKSIRATLYGLGLTRINKSVSRQNTPEIRGMIRKIQHLVVVED